MAETQRTTTPLSSGPVPNERFWYVQEAGEGGRYLRIHADHMIVDEETGALTFCEQDGSVLIAFGGGEWSYMEHGETPFSTA